MQSLGFEALRNLTIRHLVRYGEALVFVYLYPHNSALQWCRMRLMVPHITGNTTVSWRLAQAPTTEYINIPHYWPFVKGIHRDRWIPCCLCIETYHHVYSIQNYIYTPVPGVSSPVENRSCSESYWCCVRWVTPFSWCKSVLTGRSWLYGYNVEHNSGRWGVSLRFWGTTRLQSGLPCRSCSETCSHDSSIQNYSKKWPNPQWRLFTKIAIAIWCSFNCVFMKWFDLNMSGIPSYYKIS